MRNNCQQSESLVDCEGAGIGWWLPTYVPALGCDPLIPLDYPSKSRLISGSA